MTQKDADILIIIIIIQECVGETVMNEIIMCFSITTYAFSGFQLEKKYPLGGARGGEHFKLLNKKCRGSSCVCVFFFCFVLFCFFFGGGGGGGGLPPSTPTIKKAG